MPARRRTRIQSAGRVERRRFDGGAKPGSVRGRPAWLPSRRKLHVESRSASCPEESEAIRAGRRQAKTAPGDGSPGRPRTFVHGTTEDGRGSAAGVEKCARGNDQERRTGAFVLCREG